MRGEKFVVAAALVFSGIVAGSERRFTYTYDSSVLGVGHVELEPWTTVRLGRTEFYRRFDNRLEFEAGLTDRLQTALYINTSAKAQGPAGARTSEFELEGIASEWKYKLTDPVADAFGSALYLEATASTLEAEVEGKAILDKRFGDWLAAVNLVGEQEWSVEEPGTEPETKLELDAGLAWIRHEAWSLGLELRSVTRLGSAGYSVLYAGPTAGYAAESWWAALSVMPQVVALSGATTGPLALADQERLQVRLLMGFHL